MKTRIYDYRDYKEFVKDWIASCDNGGRGKRRQLADDVGCQVSHVTAVLSGDAEFSLEQAEGAARFLGLDDKETEYFVLLVQHARAGTGRLRALFERQMKERRLTAQNLKDTLQFRESLDFKDEARYYASWIHAAVHVLISIPGCSARDQIAARLQLSLPKVDRALGFLCEVGLIEKKGQFYHPRKPLLHLDKSSPHIAQHHTNWRLRSILALAEDRNESLHYSSVFTLSLKDFDRVRTILSQALSEGLDVIKASPEEEIAAMNIDLYRL